VTRVAFAVPGDLATPTGGYGYDRRIIAELRALGWQVDVVSLGDGFPRPSAEQRAIASSRLKSLPDGVPVIIDGLALGALPEEAETIERRAPLVALVHHPLALETGLSPDDAVKLFESERTALASAHAVIVTSPTTGRWLTKDYEVPPENITVAPPGTSPGPTGPRGLGSGPGSTEPIPKIAVFRPELAVTPPRVAGACALPRRGAWLAASEDRRSSG